jgi:predicted dehydrogenase
MTRLALIGCGGISKGHARRFNANSDRMKVVVTLDIDEERARTAAEDIGADKHATDFREILPEVDAVLIALPHHLHHRVGMECLEAGKHVLMEKPLANTEEECLELIETSKKQDRVLMVAYCMRFHPLLVKVKELIDSKAFGDIFHLSVWTEQYTHPQEGSWLRNAKMLGGGQLFSHGCHYIDILLWLMGKPVQGTHVGTNFGTPWMEMEGTSDVSIRFENGAIGYHMGTWGARGTKLRYSLHAHGTKGMLELDFSNGQLIAHHGALEEQKGAKEVLMEVEGHSKNMELEMAHFLDCIETGATPITDGPTSLQGLRTIWRLYEAEQKNIVADLRGLGFENAVS